MKNSGKLPQISNIKFRFNLNKHIYSPPLDCLQIYHNFEVIRIKNLVITVFNHRGKINITGVKHFNLIKKTLNLFNHIFGENVEEKNIVIDNSTSSGNIFHCFSNLPPIKRVNLVKLKQFIDESGEKEQTISLRPHFFPAAVIRKKKLCTCLLFATGKYIIIGAKSEEKIKKTFNSLCATIYQLWKTTQRGTKCVLLVD